MTHRSSSDETFLTFSRRHDVEALKAMCAEVGGMSAAPRPPIPQLIPESAPFTTEQRTWLNGFFAGLASLDGTITPLSSAESAALMPTPPAAARGRRRRSALARPDASNKRKNETR